MCQVLRCDNKPDGHRVAVHSSPLFEVAVCAEHHARIEAGETCTYSWKDNVIYMGTDLQAEGILKVTDFTTRESGGRLHGVEDVAPSDPVITLHMETLSGEPHEPIQVVIPEQLRKMLAFWIDRDLPYPGPARDE